jgi:hypothetical protein
MNHSFVLVSCSSSCSIGWLGFEDEDDNEREQETSNLQLPTRHCIAPCSMLDVFCSVRFRLRPALGQRALPGNDSWTQSARAEPSRLSKGEFCPFWSHLRDTLGIIWDRPNRIRGLFRTIGSVFVETECGIPLANSKVAVAKGNS